MTMLSHIKLQTITLREGKRFVVYSPALDLSTSGTNIEEARKNFEQVVVIFFKELNKKGTTEEVLSELGWHKEKKEFKPPIVISQQSLNIGVPVCA